MEGDDPEATGSGFELVGLLSIFDPPRGDTKKTIDDALAPCSRRQGQGGHW